MENPRSMKNVFLLLLLSTAAFAQHSSTLKNKGLIAAVEVLRDANGVNHIYAQNEHDLFFAQGYCAAKDRLFQFEIWRRQATGTVAEILGERELQRDIGARLFRFRGDLTTELNHYHPRGGAIIRAFTDGVNAWIDEVLKDQAKLPLEFRLLGLQPGRWTPDVVVSRHQGLLNNLTRELTFGRAVAAGGAEKVKELVTFEPGTPNLELDPLLTLELLQQDLIAPYEAFRKPLSFQSTDLKVSQHENLDESLRWASSDLENWNIKQQTEYKTIGSNNWIVSGTRSSSGFPLLANDPHRSLATPSLRYLVHLSAPGWNVVGGGEPVIPGVSIGHNDYGAWGLTIFELDAEDLYIYEIDSQNPRRYRHKGNWLEMRIIRDTIQVKGKDPVPVEHLFTVHGPVTYVDQKRQRAAAVRAGWLESGNAPYLASLRMGQATDWNDFRDACSFSFLPGENMIWADRKGNIGWQVVGQAPIRKNWTGLLPIPGDGRFEWSGFLPIKKLPHIYNPEKGFWATANENNVPEGYANRKAVGWTWAEKYRVMRINEVLSEKSRASLDDMMKLQSDYLSIPARELVPLLTNTLANDPVVEATRKKLLNWDFKLEANSVEAGIYMAWEKELENGLRVKMIPPSLSSYIRSVPINKVISILKNAQSPFATSVERDRYVVDALSAAIKKLTERFGAESSEWIYGQSTYHHVRIKHVLSNSVNDSLRALLDHGPLPRGGSGQTPGMTGSSDNQTSGASFRIAVDLADWDNCKFTNTPGQSGDPLSPFYRNLFPSWAEDKHFTVPFSKSAVERQAVERWRLEP
jgi:penicillin amidase